MPTEDKERDELIEKLSQKWKKRLKEVREYEITDEEDGKGGKFVPSGSNIVHPGDFQKAEQLKNKLRKKYKGKTFDDVFNGTVLNTPHGICYHIESRFKIDFDIISPEKLKKKLLNSMKLIYGIGDVTETMLKNDGYHTIKDLVKHPVYKKRAEECLRSFESADCLKLSELVGHWYSKSHPLSLFTSGFHKKEDFIFFDLETMGLFNRPIILFGMARVEGNEIVISQYLLRDFTEEPGALYGFIKNMNEQTALVTFNGKSFDVPYVEERLAYYGIQGSLRIPHFDILHFSRRAWKGKFPDCSLSTLERYLFGIQRIDDVPGALVPDFYDEFVSTKNIGTLVPIVEHNKQDLISLARLFAKLHEEWGEE
ncbi:ribonuclease H-like domain-containing protein [bacterium]|nr:ribonuclease H-like domain-containing protein [bacterium]